MRIFDVGSDDPATTTIGGKCFRWLIPQKPVPSNAVTPNYTPEMAV